MGLLSWWKGKDAPPPPRPASASAAVKPTTRSNTVAKEDYDPEVAGMNGAVKVRRPNDVTVFEFGSVKASGDKVTLAGYCPVSDELEPCRWEIVEVGGSEAPQFRIVF